MGTLFPFLGEDGEEKPKEITKACIYCGEQKPLSEYWKHLGRYDGHDGRCKDCIRQRIKDVKDIRKTAPPVSPVCECCGKPAGSVENHKKVKLCLDHCSKTNTFRGWICGPCNSAIGLLGDNLEGVMKAVEYLKKDRSKNA